MKHHHEKLIRALSKEPAPRFSNLEDWLAIELVLRGLSIDQVREIDSEAGRWKESQRSTELILETISTEVRP